MKRLSNIITVAAVSLMLTGCGLYQKYEQKTEIPANVFGYNADGSVFDGSATGDSTSIAQMSWREFFTDPMLQQLIEQVLANNTDLNSARIAVEKSEAALKMARMAYLPSLQFAPQGALARFDNNPWSKTYDLPLQLSLDLDVFGSITNQKRASKAALLQAQMSEQVVRSNLIALTAHYYYYLQMLDQQLDILVQTDSLWKKSLDTQMSLWENGKSYKTAVSQMEASYLDVKTQIVDIRRLILFTENMLCSMLGSTPQHIARQKGGSLALAHPDAQGGETGQHMFDTKYLRTGFPSAMLERRPDIRMANHAMEEAFYNTKAARAAFFPSITLSGSAGWTNSAGGLVVDPGKLLLSAIGQLTQPIFARGKLKANLRIAQLTEEDLQKKYVQTVIDAGNDVNEAMADCMAAREKQQYYHRQIEVLREAYRGTHELMDNGKASYLEVLTAQESLLSAQLSEVSNLFDGTLGVVALYVALGGGVE